MCLGKAFNNPNRLCGKNKETSEERKNTLFLTRPQFSQRRHWQAGWWWGTRCVVASFDDWASGNHFWIINQFVFVYIGLCLSLENWMESYSTSIPNYFTFNHLHTHTHTSFGDRTANSVKSKLWSFSIALSSVLLICLTPFPCPVCLSMLPVLAGHIPGGILQTVAGCQP